MKKLYWILTVSALVFTVFIVMGISATSTDAKYIGAGKCKMCHKSEKRGNQFGKWEAGPHAKGLTVLCTDEAKAVARKAGVEGNPQESAKCLVCHVTAFDAPDSVKEASFKQEEGVGCEACHGPGSLYKSMKVMKALTAGTQDAKAVAYVRGDKETCLKCHNKKSPTYKPFDYAKAWAKIEHNIPQ